MYNFKINKIITNANQEIIPKNINIIIGPNNSGKSTFLKDINKMLTGIKDTIVINKMDYNLPESAEEFIESYSLKERIYKTYDNQYRIKNYSYSDFSNVNFDMSLKEHFNKSNIYVEEKWEENLHQCVRNFYEPVCTIDSVLQEGKYSPYAIVRSQTVIEDIVDGKKVIEPIEGGGGRLYISQEEAIDRFISIYGNLFFNYLGTEEKLLTIRCQEKYGYLDYNTNFLSEVQQKSDLLKSLSQKTLELFGKDIYLDRYNLGNKLTLKVGDSFEFIRNSEREDSKSEIQLSKYSSLDDEGDGIKAFVASYISLNMDDKNILLLDEPEAFLHPPLARKVGEIVGEVSNSNKQIFIATHSPEILKGILSKTDDVNIIRITRNNELNIIKELKNEDINIILKDPLLMASSILNGLFCEKVYLVESDADERFYQALYVKTNPFDGAYFTHGQNKETLKRISNIYNTLGVTNILIYDFDILRVSTDFNRVLKRVVDNSKKQKYTDLRKEMEDYISVNMVNKAKKDQAYHHKGVDSVPNEMKLKLIEMIEDLKSYNIFILKTGCLETTLQDVGIGATKNKNTWIIKALEKINDLSKEQLMETNVYKELFDR